jgi:hypothetical protein
MLAGSLVVFCVPGLARAQAAFRAAAPSGDRPVSFLSGSIHGAVSDERGTPLAGVRVSALGAGQAVAVTDQRGRFELRTLPPGLYVLRARLTGFVALREQTVEVRPSGRTASTIALRRVSASDAAEFPVLAAGIGASSPEPTPTQPVAEATSSGGDDHEEMAWRIRHARRGVLRDATLADEIPDDGKPNADRGLFGVGVLPGRAWTLARATTDFLAGMPLSGQLNLFTTGSFETAQRFFTTDSFARSVAYMSVGAAVGDHGDWAVRGGLTQGDISAWIVAGSYVTRAPATHRHDVGLVYATQRYQGGNPAALSALVDGSRNAGAVYGFDTWTITPAVALTYGGRYARYDYLGSPGLFSPRLGLTLSPVPRLRVSALASRRAVAPGAEEFSPPLDAGVWLPPQRTFSSLGVGRPLEAEQTSHVEARIEGDLLRGSTVSFRVFRQRVSNQLATMFGVQSPDGPLTDLGHYLVADAGDVAALGWSAGLRTAVGDRVHGSVTYTQSRARWQATDDLAYAVLLAPSAAGGPERVYDIATSIEAQLPETATRFLVLYRVSGSFAHGDQQAERPVMDGRFDVQVRQSLPFMNFSTAQWEMLLAVRNFFHETAVDQSIYDELLVARPPRRIVSGLSITF